MNYRPTKSFWVLFCSLFILVIWLQPAIAQGPGYGQSIRSFISKKALSDIAREKRGEKGIVLIKPSEIPALEQPSASEGPNSDPCSTALYIYFAQQINGELTNTDCQLDDSSYADFYVFDGLAGEQATILMASSTIDTYLGLANQSGTFVIEDDDSGGGFNARISTTLPESGTYLILANSFNPNEFGTYSLFLSGGPNCTFAFTPSEANLPADGGTFTFDVVTQPRCYWTSSMSNTSVVTTNSSGVGNGTVTYSVTANPVNQARSLTILIRNSRFNILQAAKSCSYGLSATPISLSPDSYSGSFNVTAPTGCFWGVWAISDFLSATGSANGNGTVNFTVANNNGADRSGVIRVYDSSGFSTFTVNQTGRNCTYSVTPTQVNPPAGGMSGTYVVNTQAGCTWFLDVNQFWVSIQKGAGVGPASLPFTVAPQLEQSPRGAGIQLSYPQNGTSHTLFTHIDQAGRKFVSPFDFDGDKKTDFTVYRPSDGNWWELRSADLSVANVTFGAAGDVLVPADYTGDGKADVAVYRPSTGEWLMVRSEDGTVSGLSFGIGADIPVPADYDGDGRADIAVYRPGVGTWFILQSSNSQVNYAYFGVSTDQPVPADYDGDGKADAAIVRSLGDGTRQWWVQGSSVGVSGVNFGISTDKTVSGDYTGDGKADIAVYRPSTGSWYVLRSEDSSYFAFGWGVGGDIAAPGDYDGDGKTDAAVFRSSDSMWYVLRSDAQGYMFVPWGVSTDIPIPSVFTK